MRHTLNDLDPEYVRSVLDYSPETGVLTWKRRAGNPQFNGRFAGKPAGNPHSTGYVRVGVVNPKTGKTRMYKAHRLAFVIMKGRWPKNIIDHEDGDGLNNSWPNIQDCTQSRNIRKARTPRNNTSGHRGVSWHKAKGMWTAYVQGVDGKQKYLGMFPDKAQAVSARNNYLNQI